MKAETTDAKPRQSLLGPRMVWGLWSAIVVLLGASLLA